MTSTPLRHLQKAVYTDLSWCNFYTKMTPVAKASGNQKNIKEIFIYLSIHLSKYNLFWDRASGWNTFFLKKKIKLRPSLE